MTASTHQGTSHLHVIPILELSQGQYVACMVYLYTQNELCQWESLDEGKQHELYECKSHDEQVETTVRD